MDSNLVDYLDEVRERAKDMNEAMDRFRGLFLAAIPPGAMETAIKMGKENSEQRKHLISSLATSDVWESWEFEGMDVEERMPSVDGVTAKGLPLVSLWCTQNGEKPKMVVRGDLDECEEVLHRAMAALMRIKLLKRTASAAPAQEMTCTDEKGKPEP